MCEAFFETSGMTLIKALRASILFNMIPLCRALMDSRDPRHRRLKRTLRSHRDVPYLTRGFYLAIGKSLT